MTSGIPAAPAACAAERWTTSNRFPPASSRAFFFRALLIQVEKLRQNVFVAHARVPTICGKYGGVEVFVGQIEPGRALIVKIGQRAFLELDGGIIIFRNQARITNGADAARVRLKDIASPRPAGGAGKFEQFLLR